MIDNLFFFKTLSVAFYGKENISGSLLFNTNSEPAKNTRLYLLKQYSNQFIRSCFSNEKGEYNIKNINLKKGPFFLISHDPIGKNNAVVADNIGGENVDS